MTSMTSRQRENLKTLSAYLRSLPSKYRNFDMGNYLNRTDGELFLYKEILQFEPNGIPANARECGAVGCALGHSIFCVPDVMKFISDSSEYRVSYFCDWNAVSNACFGLPVHSDVGSFIFHYCWEGFDNTHVGAANRIDYFLRNGLRGVPEDLGSVLGFASKGYSEHIEMIMGLVDLYSGISEELV